MITVTTKSNFSFSKLAKNFNKVVDSTLEAAAKDSAEQSRINIDNSRTHIDTPMKKLSSSTLFARKRGIYWEGDGKTIRTSVGKQWKPTPIKKGLKNKGGDMPLMYTGSLYNSIKANKKTLSMLKYGEKHNQGYAVNGNSAQWHVPARPFIEVLAGEKSQKKFNEQIKRYLKK